MGKFSYDIEGSGNSSKDFNVYTGVSQTYKPNKKLSITPNVEVSKAVSGSYKEKTKSVSTSVTYKPNNKLSISPKVGVSTGSYGPDKTKTKSVGGSVTYSFTDNASLTAGGVKNLHSAKGPGYKGKGKDWNTGITFEYSWGGSKKK